ncbi:aldose 1-epimerase family protein [Aciditerrimonas ferrireducens]|jgi:aldose 1-epimerase|uniref:Aldose 1-epimerase family protein n=1 Tax=Aciditerrimonas ferrireducens TaxID=667306 RepID=A0ABV6C5U8_9ACTN
MPEARRDGVMGPAYDGVPSGRQYVIGHGGQRVVVTEVGATLRSYEVDGQAVLDGFGAKEVCSSGRGQVLAPWPNRLGDGRYQLLGKTGRAPLDEPERRNAIHGLVRWLPWKVLSSAQNLVVMGCRLLPQPAYPWCVDLRVEYRLGRGGLTVTATAQNPSDEETVPLGLGFHPYLTVGLVPVDRVRLQLPARTRLVADERGLPTGRQAVAGTEYDFLAGRVLGPTRLDTAFTDLVRDEQGRATATLEHPATGRAVRLWVDRAFGYLMVYSADGVEPASRRRAAVAIEPMTCPPDALRSGQDLVMLAPLASWQASWGIEPLGPGAEPLGHEDSRAGSSRVD